MNFLSREIVGGQYFLRTKDYLRYLPWLYAFSAASRLIPPTEVSFWLWLGADTLALLAMFVWFVVGDRVLFRRRESRPVALLAVVSFGAILGGLKGFVTGAAGAWWGLEPDLWAAVGDRVMQTALIGAWLVPATSIFAAALAALSEERSRLMAFRVSEHLKKPWLLAPLLAQRTSPLVEELVKTQAEHPEGLDGPMVRDVVTRHLKPLSQALWEKVGREVPPYRLWQLYAVFFRNPSGIPWFAIALMSVTLWPAFATSLGSQHATAAVFSTTIAAVAVFALTGRIAPKRIGVGLALIVLSSAATVVVAGWGMNVLGVDIPSTVYVVVALTVGLWLLVLVVNVGALEVLRRSRQQVRRELDQIHSDPFGEDPGMEDSVVVDAKLAKLLHHDVQNRLLAMADEAESQKRLVPSCDLVEAITDATEKLGAQRGPVSLESRLEDITRRWAGVLDVDIGLSLVPAWCDGSGVEDVISDVVTEALTNATRHGLATAITGSVDVSDKPLGHAAVSVTIADNGVGPRGGAPGLGTHLLDTVSPGGWSLEAGLAGGSVLRVTITADSIT